MVQVVYFSGKFVYGVGVGNFLIVIDDIVDIDIVVQNMCIFKIFDFGFGCLVDGNIIIQCLIYDQMVVVFEVEGGYLCNVEEKVLFEKVMWDEKGN